MTADGTGAVAIGANAIASAIGEGSSVTNNYGPLPEPPPGEDRIQEELGRYAKRVRASLGRLDLDVLIPSEEGEHPAVELQAVFVPPLLRADPPPVELPRELRQRLEGGRAGEPPPGEFPPGLDAESVERMRLAYRDRPPVESLEVLTDPQQPRVVLLGDPGAGKSTLARYLTLALTCGPVPEHLAGLAGRVPVVVELRRYADERWRDRSFEDYLHHLSTLERMSVPRGVLETLLPAGRMLVIFDGLDELFEPEVRAETGRRIAAFADRYPGVRVVATSRTIGYQRATLDSAGFRHYMIQDLTPSQIRLFTRHWYRVVCPGDPESAARLQKRITDAVRFSQPVRDLAGNPLLLTILSIIGRRRALPRDRQGVYGHAVDILVARWDQEAKHLPPPGQADMPYINDADRRALLRLLARRMQEGDGGIAGNHIHGEDLEAVFTGYLEERYRLAKQTAVTAARGMIRQFRERNFILSRFGDEVYGFVHRAFLEYLAADDIARRYQRDREWSEEELIQEVFEARAKDPAWHEVLLLLVGMLGERDAGRVVDALLRLHAHDVVVGRHDMLALAVRALAEVERIDLIEPQSDAVVSALIDLMERQLDWTALNALESILPALSVLGPEWHGRERYLRWFLLRGQFQAEHQIASGIVFGAHSDPAALLLLAEHTPYPETRTEILRLLLQRWPDELPGAWDLVRGALDAPDAESRRGALENIARYWQDDADVRPLLFECAVSDPDPEPRREALESVAERWPDREDAHELVVRRTAAEPAPASRRLALQLLRRHWPERADTWELITDRAVADPDPAPRQEALRLLATCRADHQGVRHLLLERAVADPAPEPRAEALSALARHWRDSVEVRELVLRQAVFDPDSPARRGAIEALAWRWKGHEGVRDLLFRRALEDPGPEPRREALEALVWCWRDDAETWELALRQAVDDPHPDVRWGTMQLLARRSPDREAVQDLLLRQVIAEPEPKPRGEALWLLAELWNRHEGVRKLLAERAVADPRSGPRWVALQVLARHWPERADVQRLIVDRMTADPSSTNRRNALNWCAWLREAEPDTHETIRSVALNDPAPRVRITALRVLAFGWPRLPATTGFLRERADGDPDEGVREAAVQALGTAQAFATLPDGSH
ncbi:HEAT repeat domain-containing protein [Streptomyces sp. NPDC001406]|uniref:HEAT repeat domain-containing protein n=1 Tax=Streptomyces sp. NPDC001406 TaxID=3364572 RepID=UPI0036925761